MAKRIHWKTTGAFFYRSETSGKRRACRVIVPSYSRIHRSDSKEINDLPFSDARNVFVVRSLVTEAPVTSFDNVAIPRLEKILVDLVCEKDLFVSFQGEELRNIYHRALKDYDVSLSTLRRYARRRGKLEEIDRLIVTQGEDM